MRRGSWAGETRGSRRVGGRGKQQGGRDAVSRGINGRRSGRHGSII